MHLLMTRPGGGAEIRREMKCIKTNNGRPSHSNWAGVEIEGLVISGQLGRRSISIEGRLDWGKGTNHLSLSSGTIGEWWKSRERLCPLVTADDCQGNASV